MQKIRKWKIHLTISIRNHKMQRREKMEKNHISWKEILAFAVGNGGCNLVWTTVGSYLTLYYTDSVGIAAATIGTLMLLR